jgi:hypothetical protein
MIYYYLCAVFTLISSAVSLGFSAEACLKAKPQGGAVLFNAKYAAARSFSLFLISIGLTIFTNAQYLITVSVIMISVQLFDGIIGIKISGFKTIGPVLTALVNAVLLALFLFNN